MTEIIENLSKNSKPYIHQIDDLDDFNKVYALLNHTSDMQENNFYPMIDGKNCSSVESLFKEFAINFKFPDYFGENWAAFDECMNDLDWLNCEKYVLFIKNFDQLLSREMHNEFEIFIDILKTMVDEWATERKYSLLSPNTISFQVVIHSEKGIKDL